MSLTSLLASDPALRAKIRAEFQYPRIALKAEMLAPPLCASHGTVGTAVDYLLRFKVQHLNPVRVHVRGNLVADSAMALMRRRLSRYGKGRTRLGKGFANIVRADHLLKKVVSQYEHSRGQVAEFIRSGELTDDMLNAALFLARLDPYFRAGVVDPALYKPDDSPVEDIRQVFLLARAEDFTAKKACYVNPTFGEGSEMVGGADADLIIDDTLIEIKTTKHLSVGREHLDQLVGYYTLQSIGGINDGPRTKPIKRVGVYFSRHGLLWSIPVNELCDAKALARFKVWMKKYFANAN